MNLARIVALAALLSGGCGNSQVIQERSWIGGCYEPLKVERAPWGKEASAQEVLVVTQVFEGTPVALGGLKEGDILLKADGEPVDSLEAFYRRVEAGAPLSELQVSVWREGEVRELRVRRGKERFRRGGMVSAGLGFSLSLDLWPDPDFNLFDLVRLTTCDRRLELEAPRVRALRALGKDGGKGETRSSEGYRFFLLPFGFGRNRVILSQEG